VSLRSLQDESYELVNVTVHIITPHHRGVQKIVEELYRGVSGQAPGGSGSEMIPFR